MGLAARQPVGVRTVRADVAESRSKRRAGEEVGLALIAALLCESDLRLQLRLICAGEDVAVVEHPMLDVLSRHWVALRYVNFPDTDAILKNVVDSGRIKLGAGRDC